MAVREVALAGGTVISCRLSGDPGAPPMVLLHALGEDAGSWDEVAAWFATGFRIVALDLRGHGTSTWPGAYSFPLLRDDVLGVLDALDLSDLVLVGHSMGGIVAYLVAQAQPGRISRLVVEDAAPPFPRDRPVPARPAGELGFDWTVVAAIVEEINDPSRRWWTHLGEITAPTLLVGGGPTSHIPQQLLAVGCLQHCARRRSGLGAGAAVRQAACGPAAAGWYAVPAPRCSCHRDRTRRKKRDVDVRCCRRGGARAVSAPERDRPNVGARSSAGLRRADGLDRRARDLVAAISSAKTDAAACVRRIRPRLSAACALHGAAESPIRTRAAGGGLIGR